MIFFQLILGFGVAFLIAWFAYIARSLTVSGALAATIIGGLLFGLGGLPWALLLLAFFISSSLMSRLFSARKEDLGEKFSKGSRRDWGQVFANGGAGVILVVLYSLTPDESWTWLAFGGVMAAVNADTWATELGVLSKKAPYLITNGKIVERGTSGGVSLAGTLASLGGAALIGLLAALVSPNKLDGHWLFVVCLVTTGGLAGSILDSFLGATIQGIYTCPVCAKETERHPLHTCGAETRHVRGWMWLNNDLVNTIASLFGALIVILGWLISYR